MSKTKVSNIELEHLVRQGLGVSEIARKVGVSKGTVSSRLKALNVAINQNVILHHAGEIVIRENPAGQVSPAAKNDGSGMCHCTAAFNSRAGFVCSASWKRSTSRPMLSTRPLAAMS